jgi:hypothetical protein
MSDQKMKFLATGTATDGSKFNLYLDESKVSEAYVSPFKEVTEAIFWDFIEYYPVKLEQDFFMDSYTWNDFQKADKWPESVVAKVMLGYDVAPNRFYVLEA